MKENFSDKHPLASLLLFSYGSFVIAEFLIGVIVTMLLAPTGVDKEMVLAICGSIGSLLILVFWYLRNRPQYRFMPRKGEISGSFKLMIGPKLFLWVMIFGLYAYFAKGSPFGPIGLKEVFMCLMAGLVEEVCFREIAVSFMAKHWLNEKTIPWIAVASGVLFGLTHLANGIGDDVIAALEQTVLTVFFGIFYAAVYLCKGNVWVSCFFHVVHDLLAFMAVAGMAGIGELPDWTVVYMMFIEFILSLIGFYYLRKEKRQEIIDLWDYKWSRKETSE